MSHVLPASCSLDWDGDANSKLRGGRLLAVSNHLFAYVFPGDGTPFANGFIAAKFHGQDIPTLLTAYPVELKKLLGACIKLLDGSDYNVYANEGYAAGMTISQHAHLHVLRRSDCDLAAGMGLGKLIKRYNIAQQGLLHLGT